MRLLEEAGHLDLAACITAKERGQPPRRAAGGLAAAVQGCMPEHVAHWWTALFGSAAREEVKMWHRVAGLMAERYKTADWLHDGRYGALSDITGHGTMGPAPRERQGRLRAASHIIWRT
ncbi:hypothetical protein NDU88_004538 [Pleurodeles waltl]|uniref:Uncharacterized protein n=1 Tax=Pleurodeles waltl TaxID=8319 RepID=A0AAV7WVY9_PLEWA|nr:hypothetical protein NDU88_004538 [Pleurodeles waltl]